MGLAAKAQIGRGYCPVRRVVSGRGGMIRVGFVFDDSAWIGGIRYLRNLLSVVFEQPQRKIEPVIITRRNIATNALEGFPALEHIQTSLVETTRPTWKL